MRLQKEIGRDLCGKDNLLRGRAPRKWRAKDFLQYDCTDEVVRILEQAEGRIVGKGRCDGLKGIQGSRLGLKQFLLRAIKVLKSGFPIHGWATCSGLSILRSRGKERRGLCRLLPLGIRDRLLDRRGGDADCFDLIDAPFGEFDDRADDPGQNGERKDNKPNMTHSLVTE